MKYREERNCISCKHSYLLGEKLMCDLREKYNIFMIVLENAKCNHFEEDTE